MNLETFRWAEKEIFNQTLQKRWKSDVNSKGVAVNPNGLRQYL